jgi:hypothetical protein
MEEGATARTAVVMTTTTTTTTTTDDDNDNITGLSHDMNEYKP